MMFISIIYRFFIDSMIKNCYNSYHNSFFREVYFDLKPFIFILLILLLTGCRTNQVVIEKDINSTALDYLMPMPVNLPDYCKTLNDTEFAKELKRQTKINVNFRHYSSNAEVLTIISSGQLPDILEQNWLNFSGGPEHSIKNGYILKLNDIIENYSPNLKNYLDNNPDMKKAVMTSSGSYYAYPFIRSDKRLLTFTGLIVRSDILEELSLPVPVTINDWETALRAFKQNGFDYPFVCKDISALLPFFGAFDVWPQFYNDNGSVKHGCFEPNYLTALETLSRWYSEGLIDPYYSTTNESTLNIYVLTGKSAAFTGYAGYTMGYIYDKDPSIKLAVAPYPIQNPGDEARFAIVDPHYSPQMAAAITTKCKDIVSAAALLDYGYGEKGHLLFNFGIENESYTMVDNKPVFTENVINNKQGLITRVAMALYHRGSYSGPFIQDFSTIEQYYNLPEQKECFEVWKNDAEKYLLPAFPDGDDMLELRNLYYNVLDHINEQQIQFISGLRPLSELEKFKQELLEMGYDKLRSRLEGNIN